MISHPKKPARGEPSAVRGAHATSAVGIEKSSRHQRARRSSFFIRTMLWITSFICVAFLLGTLAQAWSNMILNNKIQNAQTLLTQAQKEHGSLQKDANYYNDPEVIAAEARQQFGYIKPGEKPVVIIPAASPTPPANEQKQTSPASSPQETGGHWSDWLHTLFGI